MHTTAEMGVDTFQADRLPDQAYRTAPFKGPFTRTEGGFFHDGRFAMLLDVVNHYDGLLGLKLGEKQNTDLVEYLKSL